MGHNLAYLMQYTGQIMKILKLNNLCDGNGGLFIDISISYQNYMKFNGSYIDIPIHYKQLDEKWYIVSNLHNYTKFVLKKYYNSP
jgi:hypothetical protein